MSKYSGGRSAIGLNQQDTTAQEDVLLERLKQQAAERQAEQPVVNEPMQVEQPAMGVEGAPIEMPAERLGNAEPQPVFTPEESAARAEPEEDLGYQDPIIQQSQLDITPSQEQREAERVPSMQELNQLEPGMENLRGVFNEKSQAQRNQLAQSEDAFVNSGELMGDRLARTAVRAVQQVNSIGLARNKAREMVSTGTQISTQTLADMDANNETKPSIVKGGVKLSPSATNFVLSPNVLNAGSLDPDFVADTKKEGASKEYNMPAKLDYRFPVVLASVLDQAIAQDEIRNEMVGDMSQQEISDLEKEAGIPEVLQEAVVSDAVIGREIFKTWRRAKAEMDGEPTDSYVDDYQNMTEVGFEAIGKWAKELYAASSDDVVIVEGRVNPDGSKIAPTLRFTTASAYRMRAEADLYRTPDFKIPPMNEPTATGLPAYEARTVAKPRTGSSVKGAKTNKDEVQRKNLNMIPNVWDSQRSKLHFLFSAAAFTNAAFDNNMNPTENYSYVHEALDMGQSRVNKIKNIAKKQKAFADKAQLELDDVRAQIPRAGANPFLWNKANELEAKVAMYTKRADEFSKPDWQRKMYFLMAGKALETTVLMSKMGSKPFHYSYFFQGATRRATAHQYQISPQTNHFARNVVGSGKKYTIKPGEGSSTERAFLETIGAIFFGTASSTPDAALRDVRNEIGSRSDAYQYYVGIGNKLKAILDEFNPEAVVNSLQGVRSTPQGIMGVDQIPKNTLAKIDQDPALKAFMESITSGEGKAHKHFIQTLDAVIELAKYDAAKKAGTSFTTSMNAMEVDGISNGLATMFAVLGLTPKLYRSGVLRAEGQEKILGAFADVEGIGEFEGDIRDVLEKNLEANLSGGIGDNLLTSKEMMDQFGYGPDDFGTLKDILALLIQDKDFKKQPLMTFAYGQELDNLIGGVYNSMLSSPEIMAIAGDFNGGVPAVANIMNEFLKAGVVVTLGPEVVAFQEKLKTFIEASAMFDKLVVVDSPAGGVTTFGKQVVSEDKTPGQTTKVSVRPIVQESGEYLNEAEKREGELTPAEKKSLAQQRAKQKAIDDANAIVDRKVAQMRQKLEADVQSGAIREGYPEYNMRQKEIAAANQRRLRSAGEAVISPKTREFSPLAVKNGITGGYARGQVLATSIQSYDGATVQKVVTDYFDSLNPDGKPFIVPIYDAFVTDLGSFEGVRDSANRAWFDLTQKNTFLDSLSRSVRTNMKEGREEYKKLAEENPNGPLDMEKSAGQIDFIRNKLERMKTDTETKAQAVRISKELQANPTNFNLYKSMIFLMKHEFGDISSAVVDIVSQSRKNKHELAKVYKEQSERYAGNNMLSRTNGVYQFSIDDPGIFKLLNSSGTNKPTQVEEQNGPLMNHVPRGIKE